MKPSETTKRRHKIQLQHFVEVKDGAGYPTGESKWEPFATVWASRKGLQGSEYYAAAAINSKNNVEWRIMFRKGVTSEHRVYDVANKRSYDIHSPVPADDLKKELILYTVEVEDDAS